MKNQLVLVLLITWGLCLWVENLGGYPIDDMKISKPIQRKVAAFIFGDIPQQEVEHALNTAVNKKIEPLVINDPKNPFGSMWGETTARMAANVLQISLADAKNQLATSRPTRVKTEQGVAGAVLKRRIRDDLQKKGLEIALDFRLDNQIQLWKLRAKELGCNKTQAANVAECMLEVISSQTKFGAMVNQSTLLTNIAKAAASNQPIELNALRCPPQIDSKDRGILVDSRMKFEVEMAEGKRGVVDHEEILKKVGELKTMFDRHGIPAKTKISLVDVDAFIQEAENRESGVNKFGRRLESSVEKLIPGGARLERVTKKIGVDDLNGFFNLPGVKEISSMPTTKFSEKHVEKVVNECFEKLQPRNLPPELKTREAARVFAGKNMAVEFKLGEMLGAEENQIFLQRSTTSSAADTFLAGAKQANKKPPFLFFWVDRIKEVK